jgi:hypothetical protein
MRPLFDVWDNFPLFSMVQDLVALLNRFLRYRPPLSHESALGSMLPKSARLIVVVTDAEEFLSAVRTCLDFTALRASVSFRPCTGEFALGASRAVGNDIVQVRISPVHGGQPGTKSILTEKEANHANSTPPRKPHTSLWPQRYT